MKTWTATVYGTAWAGYKANTEYTFYTQPTRERVMNKAGDFSSVTRIVLRCTETTVTRCKLAKGGN